MLIFSLVVCDLKFIIHLVNHSKTMCIHNISLGLNFFSYSHIPHRLVCLNTSKSWEIIIIPILCFDLFPAILKKFVLNNLHVKKKYNSSVNDSFINTSRYQ